MAEVLKAIQKSLKDVFSDEYMFKIPVYQRPYAWTTDQADDLLDDLQDAMKRAPESPYFLGSIVLIKDDGVPDSQVVDGQQRLTTLTILFSVLRELAHENERDALDTFVREKGQPYRGTQDRFRLRLGKRDAAFFESNVQENGSLSSFLQADAPKLTDSQELIRSNARHFLEALKKLDHAERKELAMFIAQRCYLVVVTATDQEAAYRIFFVMNDRGMDLSPTDILKATIIGKLPGPEQDHHGERWEQVEDGLGRDDFRDLFAHIRMIYAKTKLRVTLQADFQDKVLSELNDRPFIDDVLEPYAAVYEIVTRASFESRRDAEHVNVCLRHLDLLDNFDWVPPAMSFFRRNEGDYDAILRFSRALERLAYGLFITRANINERISRYGEILRLIEKDAPTSDYGGPLQLDPQEKRDVLEKLDAPIYSPYSRVMRPLLLRLNSALSEAGVKYTYPTISIEHVLPQNPAPDSEWAHWFSDLDEREYWTHRLANLVLLSFRKNAKASNFEFSRKKTEYFGGGDVTSFPLTTQVLSRESWTPAVLKERQRSLIGVLASEWRLEDDSPG